MFGWFKKDKKDENNEIPDDSELEKEGYDPEKDESVGEYKEDAITDFTIDYPGYLDISNEELK